jgi:hypothetical protein
MVVAISTSSARRHLGACPDREKPKLPESIFRTPRIDGRNFWNVCTLPTASRERSRSQVLGSQHVRIKPAELEVLPNSLIPVIWIPAASAMATKGLRPESGSDTLASLGRSRPRTLRPVERERLRSPFPAASLWILGWARRLLLGHRYRPLDGRIASHPTPRP